MFLFICMLQKIVYVIFLFLYEKIRIHLISLITMKMHDKEYIAITV